MAEKQWSRVIRLEPRALEAGRGNRSEGAAIGCRT
jgi:hypothetical protein